MDPGTGEYVSGNVWLAARRIGSRSAREDVRAQFRTPPSAKRFVFAGNASVGLATAFPREIITGSQGGTTLTTVEDPL